MGEAKRRREAAEGAFGRLDAELKSYGILTDRFGFYDQDAFVERERERPDFLEQYAMWVLQRPVEAAYEKRVREIVPRLGDLVSRSFAADGFQGGCVAASGMISRMLDRLGVWSFGLSGSTIFEVKKENIWRGLQSVDFPDFPGAVIGHAWVCAPPYLVVDATASLQNWKGDKIVKYLPPTMLIDSSPKIIPTVDDVVSAEVREHYLRMDGRLDTALHYRLEPRLRSFGRDFRAVESDFGQLRTRYVPTAVRQPDVELELINSEGKIGRSGNDLWANVILPELRDYVVLDR
jgi:hypothetical protein